MQPKPPVEPAYLLAATLSGPLVRLIWLSRGITLFGLWLSWAHRELLAVITGLAVIAEVWAAHMAWDLALFEQAARTPTILTLLDACRQVPGRPPERRLAGAFGVFRKGAILVFLQFSLLIAILLFSAGPTH